MAFDDPEIRQGFVGQVPNFQVNNACQGRSLGRDGLEESGNSVCPSGGFDLHTIGLVAYPAQDLVLLSQPVNMRAKPHPLNNPLDADMHVTLH
jgi:hypothetical protein